MGTMIDFSQIAADARKNSGILDVPVFERGMGAYRRPVNASAVQYVEGGEPGDPGRVQAMNTEYMDLGAMADMRDRNLNGMQGGEGGNMRSYVPMLDLNNAGLVSKVPETTFGDQPETAVENGLEQQKSEVEQIAQYGDIPQLLEALHKMATMEPGKGGNPVFQLDDMYKNSSATQGIPGTVAQYPTAGGTTRETDYNL